MEKRKYLITILGNYKNIQKDLNFIADPDFGVNYIDGKGVFLGSFYSHYTVSEISESLKHMLAFLLFDITDDKTNHINLPTKYINGLFPELEKNTEQTIKKSVKKTKPKQDLDEFDNVNDILDKLIRNKYDRTCLTKKEIKILENNS